MKLKSNKFKVAKPARRSTTVIAAMNMGHKIIPNKAKETEKKACRNWKEDLDNA